MQTIQYNITHWFANEALQVLHDLLVGINAEYRFVGGCLRDELVGKSVADFDVATTMSWQVLQRYFTAKGYPCQDKGVSHGVISVMIQERKFDIATLRLDVETDGRHANIIQSKSWYDDSLRRDLTVNALSITPEGCLYDYHQGIRDIKMQKLRFVGNARARIHEDYLRILRYFRFAGELGWDISQDLQGVLRKYIEEAYPSLHKISSERMGFEMVRLMASAYPLQALQHMHKLGILEYLGCNDDGIDIKRFQFFLSRENSDLVDMPMCIAGRLYSLFGQQSVALCSKWAIRRDVGRNIKLLSNYIDYIIGIRDVFHPNRIIEGLAETAHVIVSYPHNA